MSKTCLPVTLANLVTFQCTKLAPTQSSDVFSTVGLSALSVLLVPQLSSARASLLIGEIRELLVYSVPRPRQPLRGRLHPGVFDRAGDTRLDM